MPRCARFAEPLTAAVAAPGEDAAAPGEADVAAPGERLFAAPQEVDEILVSPPRSDSAEETAVAEESKEQDPAARRDSAAEAAFAKEELKDPSADEPAKGGKDEESVHDALSTVYGDSVIDEEELRGLGPKRKTTERQFKLRRDTTPH